MSPDLLAACVAWLRGQAAIVAAFGEDLTASPPVIKFWSDYAGPTTPALPYLVFAEPQSTESFETIDQDQDVSSLTDGTLIVNVFAESKLDCRQLADTVGESLNDAPLVFGLPAAGTGTVSVGNGLGTVTFSAPQSRLLGRQLLVNGDSSSGSYLILSGTGAAWTIQPVYGGATNAAATWSTVGTALVYFRRTAKQFPIISNIGPDSPTSFSRALQFRFLIENTFQVSP